MIRSKSMRREVDVLGLKLFVQSSLTLRRTGRRVGNIGMIRLIPFMQQGFGKGPRADWIQSMQIRVSYTRISASVRGVYSGQTTDVQKLVAP